MKAHFAERLRIGLQFAFTAVLFLCTVLTASARGGAEQSTAKQSAAAGAAGELPIVKEPLTLTMFETLNSKVASTMKSNAEIACYKEMERLTGIKVKFIHPPIGQENEQFNLMLASGDYPDIIFWGWNGVPGGPGAMLANGVILKLNDAMEKYAPYLTKLYAENPEVRRQAMLDDGSQFLFPFVKLDPFVRAGGPVVRQDWLDKLSLPLPKTMQDWYVMLKAFKEKDPNGNGKADEIPFIVKKGSDLESLNSMTAPYGVIQDFYQDNGTVKYGAMQEWYRQYLAAMNQWYKEGLLDQDFAITDSKNFDAKVTSNRAGAWIGRIANTFGRYLTLVRPTDAKFNLNGTAWPIGPAGKPYNIRKDMVAIVAGDGAAVSSKNKHVPETVRWLDYHYSPQGHMLMNFGIEGQSYTMVNGYPKYTDYVAKNPAGLAIADVIAQFAVSSFTGPIVQDRRCFEQLLTFPEQAATIETWAAGGDTSLLLPPIRATVDEGKRLAAIVNDINTYVSEMTVKFIMGAEPLSKFGEFTANIEKMGVAEAVKIQQAALQRYQVRK